MKSYLLNAIGLTVQTIIIISWEAKVFHRYPVLNLATIFYSFIASITIVYMILFVDTIKATYNATLDNCPPLRAIAFNLFISFIFHIIDIYDGDDVTLSYMSYILVNNAIMVSVSQLLMERNIRKQQQQDQHHGITIVTPTLGAVRVAIFFTCLSKVLVLISSERFYFHQLGVIINVLNILCVVVYSDFLFHNGRCVKNNK